MQNAECRKQKAEKMHVKTVLLWGLWGLLFTLRYITLSTYLTLKYNTVLFICCDKIIDNLSIIDKLSGGIIKFIKFTHGTLQP